jgi:UDP-GlcNAc3NAcA epimerase
MTHVMTVVGARPQFIKAAAVSAAIAEARQSGQAITETLVHTGQHYDYELSEVFFDQLDMAPPAYNLDVGSGSHAQQTAAIMRGMEPLMLQLRPDVVLVYGDTNSTLAAALVAAKIGIPIAHVEAGLRSRNMAMPEEINRIAADRLSQMLFTGTVAAKENLVAEGLSQYVREVGDVMLDTIRRFRDRVGSLDERLAAYAVQRDGYALATIHRAENTDKRERLTGILAGLREVARTLPVVLPLHPRTAAVLGALGPEAIDGIEIIKPVSYLDMLVLEAGARLILTDSGGVQKEAYCHGVPCVTLRDETEWVETVASGWNRLASPEAQSIGRATADAMAFDRSVARVPFYGDGHAAEKIVACLRDWRTALAA